MGRPSLFPSDTEESPTDIMLHASITQSQRRGWSENRSYHLVFTSWQVISSCSLGMVFSINAQYFHSSYSSPQDLLEMEKHYETRENQQKHFLFGLWKQQSNIKTVLMLSTSALGCCQGLLLKSFLAHCNVGNGHMKSGTLEKPSKQDFMNFQVVGFILYRLSVPGSSPF